MQPSMIVPTPSLQGRVPGLERLHVPGLERSHVPHVDAIAHVCVYPTQGRVPGLERLRSRLEARGRRARKHMRKAETDMKKQEGQ